MNPRDLVLLSCLSLAASACVGTTGGDLVTFQAAAAGPTDLAAGQPFTTDRNFSVVLTKATLHIGAAYLNTALPVSGAQDTDCILPGIYVAQVTQPVDVDLLSSAPQPFPAQGQGTQTQAIVGEVWVMHGDVNDTGDTTPVLQLSGTATDLSPPGANYPFDASITIGENRLPPVANPALPSQNPICKQHIVSPIPLQTDVTQAITPVNGGSLLLRVDPRGLFTNVDFSHLAKSPEHPGRYAFADASTDQPSINLYDNLHARYGVYDFHWIDAPNP